jgi:hypothetical protein
MFSAPNHSVNQLNSSPGLADSLIKINGGHAVLMTDFVNQGGVEGAIGGDLLQEEIARSPEELAYVKFKNSWGAGLTVNEFGQTVRSANDGYYRMDLGYLKANAAKRFLGIVIPRMLLTR